MKVNYINVTSNTNIIPELQIILIKNNKLVWVTILLASYMDKLKNYNPNDYKSYKESQSFLESLLKTDNDFIDFLYLYIDTNIQHGKINNDTIKYMYTVYDIHEYKDFFVDTYKTDKIYEMIKKERIDRINKLLDI